MSDTCLECGCVLACPICEVPIDNMEEDFVRLTEDNRKLKQLVVDLHWITRCRGIQPRRWCVVSIAHVEVGVAKDVLIVR